MLEYRKYITRKQLREEPEKLFVFGDNLVRRGYGGQAKEMRGEPNAIGIPTKKLPLMTPNAFFTDSDFIILLKHIKEDEERLRNFKGTIVWPYYGIGTGRALLKTKAPLLYIYINNLRKSLE